HTSPVIEEQKQIVLERSLQSVIKADRYEKKEDGMDYYEALDNSGAVIGWGVPLSGKGYGGPIRLLVGVDITGVITGVKVLGHSETPGLGSKINEKGYKQTEPAFLRQFNGKKNQDIVLIKGPTDSNIQAITGATISSRAVVESVRKGVEEFLAARKERP
ncbi:MAG: FMN-binding protein, partial [Candidatus Omnitrophica bacterium]|nr:FMN-binding protein [Candidatus Omnitrophota bacterium]